jgi:cell fate (sporulation/competence/biofilm development) regulator YlbF (YheA/YmcA/DUF963 family)
VNAEALPQELLEATLALADSLLAAGPVAALREAERQLNADTEALQILEQVRQAQARLRLQQASGQVAATDVRDLRELQRVLQARSTVTAYIDAQQQASAYLRLINAELSELIGVDFASLLSSSCC